MRAGRLISLMLLLQNRGKLTAAELAIELEVSERTVLRDIEALSGASVPVYSTRGPSGGFQLVDGYTTQLSPPAQSSHPVSLHGAQRADVLITAEGQRLAVLLGRLPRIRIRGSISPSSSWLRGSFLIGTIENTIVDVLSLGPHIQILEPAELREQIADRIHRTASLYPPT